MKNKDIFIASIWIIVFMSIAFFSLYLAVRLGVYDALNDYEKMKMERYRR